MIFGNINQEKTYEFLPENVKACFKYVKEHGNGAMKSLQELHSEIQENE